MVALNGSVMFQKTLKNRVSCRGVGLHSGATVTMSLVPADEDAGIVFRRTDLPGAPEIAARFDRVEDTRLCTMIGDGKGLRIGTIEHLMAAFAGLGVDNAVVELDGPEVPVMDGSSAPFVFLIECAGLVEQAKPRRVVRVLAPVEIVEGDKRVMLAPAEGFSIAFEIDFDSAAVARQEIAFDLADGVFKRELARARTFGFAEQVEQLRSLGLIRGGSLENAVVVEGDKVLNEGGLRYDDEFVRHKALDSIGDLYLAGPIVGAFVGVKSGHDLNNRLLRKLMATPSAWTYDSAEPRRRIAASGRSTQRLAASPF